MGCRGVHLGVEAADLCAGLMRSLQLKVGSGLAALSRYAHVPMPHFCLCVVVWLVVAGYFVLCVEFVGSNNRLGLVTSSSDCCLDHHALS